MLLKEKIERYENDEIEIYDVLTDDKGNQSYSLDENVDELIELFEMSPSFKEKCYIFNSVFLSHFDENRKSSPEKIEKFLSLFLEKDSLNVYVNNAISGRRNIFLNILPLLSHKYLEKNKSWLWKNINILDIDSKNIRNIFFNEYCRMHDGIIDYVFSNIIHSGRSFEGETLHNIIETIKLINNRCSSFVEGIKILYPDSYNKKIMDLFFVNISSEVKCSDESIKDYANYLIKIIKKENAPLENIILSDDIEHILTSMNPVIFDCMLDELVKNKAKVFDELINMYQESDSFKSEDDSNYEKNRSCLFIKKSFLEKRELLNNFSENDNSSEIKRRL